MVKPNPIIESAVRIHAMSVLSDAMIVRSKARSVRSSARIVPLSFGWVSAGLMGHFSGCGFSRDGGLFRGCGLCFFRSASHTRDQAAQNQIGHDRKDEGNN